MNKQADIILKDALKIVGYKQVYKAVFGGTLDKIILAADTDEHLLKKLKPAALEHGVEIIPYSSKADLGRAAGIQVACAVIGVLKKQL